MAQTREERNRIHRETYHYLKSLGICVKCQNEDAVPGKTLCLVCLINNRERQREKYRTDEAYRQRDLAKNKARKDRWREAGLCTSCGKNPPRKGYAYCYSCWARSIWYGRKKPKKGYAEAGLCIWCGAERVEGKKLCADCLEKARERALNASKAAAQKQLENPSVHFWRLDNRAIFRKRKEKPA